MSDDGQMPQISFDKDETPDTIDERDSILMRRRSDLVLPGQVKYKFWRIPYIIIIPLLLLISFSLNLTAFFVPFMTINIYH